MQKPENSVVDYQNTIDQEAGGQDEDALMMELVTNGTEEDLIAYLQGLAENGDDEMLIEKVQKLQMLIESLMQDGDESPELQAKLEIIASVVSEG